MLRNYLTVALRNIRRAPGFTFINVVGLAVGLACCLVILRYVEDEMSFDRFHAQAEHIYRITRETLEGGVATREQANTPAAVGPALQAHYAGVEAMARFLFPYPSTVLVRHGDRQFYEPGFLWADASMFDVFSFRLLRGDPEVALDAPYSLVLTQAAAEKYFGDEDPMGRTLAVEGWTSDEYRVTGVLEDLPANSHLQFELLASMAGAEQAYSSLFEGEGAWTNSLVYTYVRLADRAAAAHMAGQLPAFTDRHLGDFARARGLQLQFKLQPLTDIHLNPHVKTILETNGDVRYVYAFSTIALFILLVACINFTNLATARAARRGREVGLRKVLGAHRRQLVFQFLGESSLLSLGAFVLALGLAEVALPLFNALTGKVLHLDLFTHPGRVLAWFGLAVGIGLLAGLYPAVFLSAPTPLQVLKGARPAGLRRVTLRRVLVVFQFAVTIVLLAGTGVIYDQLTYLREKNLGFDEEQVVVVPLPDRALQQEVETIGQAWRQHPGVVNVAAASGVPGRPGLSDTWPVRRVDGEDTPVNMLAVMADPDYVQTMGFDVLAGRALSHAHPTDRAAAFLINETAVQALGFQRPEEALGRRLHWQQGDGKEGTVVGVVRDFHFRSLHQAVEPTLVHVFPERYTTLVVRVRPEGVSGTLAFLEQQWKALAPDRPFEYAFLDQMLDGLYRSDARLGQTIGVFAVLSILIACLGLFGLATHAAEQRTKEIGVRKVLGASVPGLVLLLSTEFARLVAVAFVLAVPVAYFALHGWLDNFAYRIDMSGWTFLGAGLLVLLIALLTVSYQSVRAALTDPVKVLRYE